jgi:hypothetical protein
MIINIAITINITITIYITIALIITITSGANRSCTFQCTYIQTKGDDWCDTRGLDLLGKWCASS